MRKAQLSLPPTGRLLSGARYWLGGHSTDTGRKAVFESGIAAGRAAIAIAPNKPEGHFWVAANMGALAESFGLRQGLKYRGAIKDEEAFDEADKAVRRRNASMEKDV